MTDQIPSLTDRQLKTAAHLHKIRIAERIFYFLAVAFTVFSAVLIYAALFGKAGIEMKAVFSVLDGIVGWSLKQIVFSLYPTKHPHTGNKEK